MAQFRKEKIADQLHSFLAGELRSLRDPRLQLVTLTAVEIASDLKVARVFWSAIPATFSQTDEVDAQPADLNQTFLDDSQVKEVTSALVKATGLLKRRIAEALKFRHVPDLAFVYDQSIKTGTRIDALLSSITESDRGQQ